MNRTTDEVLIETLKKLKAARPCEIAKEIGCDPKDILHRIQRLRRKGQIEVVVRQRILSITHCKYGIAEPKAKPVEEFNGRLTKQEAEEFKRSIKGTAWAQMGCLV